MSKIDAASPRHRGGLVTTALALWTTLRGDDVDLAPTVEAGSGAPTATCPLGSLYIDADTGAVYKSQGAGAWGQFGGGITGWAYYQDAADPVGSPQALVADTPAILTNDTLGANTETTYLPSAGELWASDQITPVAVGDAYTTRLDFVVQPAQTGAICTLRLDIGADPLGGSSIPILVRTFSLAKGTTAQNVSIGFPFFTLATFLANGGTITLECDKNADVWDKAFTFVKIY